MSENERLEILQQYTASIKHIRGNQTEMKPKKNPELDSDVFPMRMDSDTDSIAPIRDKAFTSTKKQKRAAFMNNMKGSLSIVSFNKGASSMRSDDERPDLVYKIDEPKPFMIEEIGEHLESEHDQS